ncbi:alpha/beta hydrolase [Actinomycetospora cinnamomea]|uniref:Alpha-beta hydrolase superfamily lysophospholipase n=1 Tax=Actinomycetospora cinnamomea TaxID=663609 RepID=A0A2U1EB22_9PSEU|nr:alpha/beta fold hydrolase [Actinomycetospora cinnamomea]PVY97085.1 alpha-beta hydrolase superfamily lysophospholipase [Actinomycetospora cinnamomea]
MSPAGPAPDTIVLIHGFWVTPRSWERWIAHYEAKGYRVIAPAYPGFEVEVDALNADPSPVEAITVRGIVEHLEEIVRGLASPPILIGHSAGGCFTQLLLDHGFGAAGAALNSAPTEGVPVVPLSQVKATFPVLRNPANRHRAVRYDFAHWNYAFTNTFAEPEARALYERYAVPVSGAILFESALANLTPGHQGTWVDYHNEDRAPLLFVAGTEDHIMPPKVQWSNAAHYKAAGTITEVVEFGGKPHLLPAAPGWEEIADYVLAWAVRHATTPPPVVAPAEPPAEPITV